MDLPRNESRGPKLSTEKSEPVLIHVGTESLGDELAKLMHPLLYNGVATIGRTVLPPAANGREQALAVVEFRTDHPLALEPRLVEAKDERWYVTKRSAAVQWRRDDGDFQLHQTVIMVKVESE